MRGATLARYVRAASRSGMAAGPEGFHFMEAGLRRRDTMRSQCASLEGSWCEMERRGEVRWKVEAGMVYGDIDIRGLV
jgi:hypothetical protein